MDVYGYWSVLWLYTCCLLVLLALDMRGLCCWHSSGPLQRGCNTVSFKLCVGIMCRSTSKWLMWPDPDPESCNIVFNSWTMCHILPLVLLELYLVVDWNCSLWMSISIDWSIGSGYCTYDMVISMKWACLLDPPKGPGAASSGEREPNWCSGLAILSPDWSTELEISLSNWSMIMDISNPNQTTFLGTSSANWCTVVCILYLNCMINV